MCGIIGYTGTENAEKTVLEGLRALEYRGYDSAGLAVFSDDGTFVTVKCRGRVAELEKKVMRSPVSGNCGIGHTRWATHGAPDEKNAHPHLSDTLALVHNGIIDNSLELRRELEDAGYRFSSETDTECVAHLIDRAYKETKDPAKAIYSACSRLCGSYALAIMFFDRKDEIYAVGKDNSLIIAVAPDGGYVASDIPALLPHGRDFIRPEEGTVYRIRKDGAYSIDAYGTEVKEKTERFDADIGAAQKDGYGHFMLKEIHEEPAAIFNAVSPRINADGLPDFSSDGIEDTVWKETDLVSVISCGSATHAGLVGRYLTETFARVPTVVSTASEYRSDPPATVGKVLAVPVSQSGETADTLAGLRIAKKNGERTVAIVNAVGSAVAREADRVIYQNAGPEIAVATTKGYATQTALLALISVKLALAKGKMTETDAKRFCNGLLRGIPKAVSDVIARRDEIKRIADCIKHAKDVYFIGRGIDCAAGYECSLKLKEISYIHSEAYAAGELKHGTLALIEKGTPVIALATDPRLYVKTAGNIREVRARGAFVILVCGGDFENRDEYSDISFVLPDEAKTLSPLATVVFAQLLAYETALSLGCDIDCPRNLAKSVTVE